MSLFNLLLWLSFIDVVLSVEADHSTSDMTNKTFLPASVHTTMMLEKLLDGYDKRLRPNFGGPPCKVYVSMHVLSMVPIKEIDMEVTAVLFFRQYWTDPRLAYGPSLGIPKVKLLGDIANQVWLPDTFFVNDLSAKISREDYLFELTQEGLITYSHRRSLRLYCPMSLHKFPMDEQLCEMMFESYSYYDDEVTLFWLGSDSVRIDPHLQIPQYTLVAWDQDSSLHEYATGNFTTLAAVFHLKRRIGFYLLQYFIPTILIIALSWVGFWIDQQSVPARVSLGITTVLALTTLIFGIQSSLPRVGHVKAIDVFLLGSFFFVFAALVEYAIICSISNTFSSRSKKTSKQRVSPCAFLEKRDNWETNNKENGMVYRGFERKQEEIQGKDYNKNCNPFSSFLVSSSRHQSTTSESDTLNQASRPSTGQRQICAIDKHCRKLFPMAYALFLLIYFAVYSLVDF